MKPLKLPEPVHLLTWCGSVCVHTVSSDLKRFHLSYSCSIWKEDHTISCFSAKFAILTLNVSFVWIVQIQRVFWVGDLDLSETPETAQRAVVTSWSVTLLFVPPPSKWYNIFTYTLIFIFNIFIFFCAAAQHSTSLQPPFTPSQTTPPSCCMHTGQGLWSSSPSSGGWWKMCLGCSEIFPPTKRTFVCTPCTFE